MSEHCERVSSTQLVRQLGVHIAQLAPHQKRRKTGQLLIAADRALRDHGLTMATLCDMVLGEDAQNRTDDALLRGVRRLLMNGRMRDGGQRPNAQSVKTATSP